MGTTHLNQPSGYGAVITVWVFRPRRMVDGPRFLVFEWMDHDGTCAIELVPFHFT